MILVATLLFVYYHIHDCQRHFRTVKDIKSVFSKLVPYHEPTGDNLVS